MNQNTLNIPSSTKTREHYIYDIPTTKRKELCSYLDKIQVWPQLAQQMHFTPEQIASIESDCCLQSSSPSEKLLKIWGNQFNHTTTELFVLLYRLRLFNAMIIIKDFVSHKHQLRIPNTKLTTKKQDEIPRLLSNSDNNLTIEKKNNLNEKKINNNIKQIPENRLEPDTVAELMSESNVKKYAGGTPEINYQELTEATNNWNIEQIWGKGGFGIVFWGYWKATPVAIKQINYRNAKAGCDTVRIELQQSLNELKYLSSCRHDNILPLYGYSIRGEHPCLVYQLMQGGSLEKRLYPKSNNMLLTYKQRIKIALGTARGINFLHTLREKPLIHTDIKPANILLDRCFTPKIGDFGLAREGPNSISTQVKVSQVYGTRPYLPPEFLDQRLLSTQVDTYSFGVVLLEMFTGLHVYDKSRSDPLLTKYVLQLYNSTKNSDSQWKELVDKHLLSLSPQEKNNCQQIILLAINCIATDPQQRPDMAQVLQQINSCVQIKEK